MKRKLFVTLLSIACILGCALSLAACDFGNGNSHLHNYVQKYDETYHWQECTNDGCNAKTKEMAAHAFGSDNRCTVCGYKKGAAVIPDDKLSVAGYSYVFSSVVVDCNGESETMYKYAEIIQEQTRNSMEGATMSFSDNGTCTSYSAGETVKGTYTQSGAKVTVTINGETNEITATENSIIISQFVPYGGEEETPETPSYPDETPDVPDKTEIESKARFATTLSSDRQIGFTVTVTFVKGSGDNKPEPPEKPDDECKHIYDKYEPIDEYYHMVYCIKCGDNYKEMHKFGEDGNGNVCDYCGYIDDPSKPQEYVTINGYSLTLSTDGKGYTIHALGSFNETELIIPSQYRGIPVTIIDEYAFQNCSSLKSITIPNSVTSIGEYAFSGCYSVESVTIPFVGNGTDKTYFGYIFGAYSDSDNSRCVPTSLKTVIITGGENIGSSAFRGCSGLTSVTIPDSITSIGRNAFYGCNSLEKINYIGDIASWCGIDGIENLTISEFYLGNQNSLVYIGNRKLQEMTGELIIPDGITSIGGYAFYGCSNITSVTIPESIKSIDYAAFYGCNSLERINYTGDLASWIELSNIDICLMSLGGTLIINGKEISGDLIIPDGTTSINSSAFQNCSTLTSVTIPDSLTSIGSYAFSGCEGLTSITLPYNITYIGHDAFAMCKNLKTVYWNAINCEAGWSNPQGAAASGIFYETDITNVVIGNKVTNIREYTFYGCSSLTSVTISDSVKSINEFAFYDCSSIETINYNGDIASWCGIDGIDYLMRYGAKTLYINGKEITGELVIPDGVTSIGYYAFRGCSGLTSIILPESVKRIDDDVFKGCSGLTSIIFNGTTEQWKAISKGNYWNEDTGNYTVHCTDGDLSKAES